MLEKSELIKQAFEQARTSGKPDWYRMTVPVLKNRLLGITNHTFSEADYGASNFTEFVHSIEHLVDIDRTVLPPVVTLREVNAEEETSGATRSGFNRYRVRADLWRAVTDYSSGTQYVWDASTQQARPKQTGEDNPVLPIITYELNQRWREEFIRTVTPIGPIPLGQTTRLPSYLLPKWNGFLRDKVKEHLENWFEETGLEPPRDLTSLISVSATRSRSDTAALRRLVIQVVRNMTASELAQLRLPPEAVLRATKERRSL